MLLLLSISILILSLPAHIEGWDDRNGDEHKDNRDMILRIISTLLCAIVNALFINPYERNFWFDMALGTLLSFGLFTFQFPLLANLWMKRWKDWYSHLSTNPNVWPDNQAWWRMVPWWGRIILTLIICAATLAIYMHPEKLISFYN